MKVPFVAGPGDLQMRDVEPPAAGPRDVVLRVGVAGICGSDLGYVAMGGPAGPSATPFPLGHELSGTVVQIGREVDAFAIGDRVVVDPLVNLIGNGGPEGGFAELLLVRDLVGRPGSLLRLPDRLSLETGALAEPLAVAAHALNRLGARPGDRVAVFGAGPIGLAAIALLRRRGVSDVVAFDLSPFRRDRAETLGARASVDPAARDAEEALSVLHGTVAGHGGRYHPGTTHFLEASGAPLLADIVGMARRHAVICVVSMQKRPTEIDFRPVMIRELTLTGALGYPVELPGILDMLERDATGLGALVSHRFDGGDFPAAFETAGRPDLAAKVLVRYDDR